MTISPAPTFGSLKGLANMLTGADSIGQVTVRVGNDLLTVCQQGILHGPFSASVDFVNNPPPTIYPVSGPTLTVFNEGAVVLCVEIISPIDAILSVESVEGDVYSAPCEAIADFSGEWRGHFVCGNSCSSPPFGDTIRMTVTQNGTSARYIDDEEYTYIGKVCGDVFRFERIDPNEIERGTMRIIAPGRAVKRSTWRMRTDPFCWGDCVDSLTRVTLSGR